MMQAPRIRRPNWAVIAAGALLLFGCDKGPGPDVCRDPNATVNCTNLSGYALFQGDGQAQQPVDGIVPFEPNSALFSDYAQKNRFAYVPAGQSGPYNDSDAFDLPVGSILIKTFAFAADLRQPDVNRRLVETRLLIHRTSGWLAIPYLWNDAQNEATLKEVGATVDVNWIHTDGQPRTDDYVVPNVNQCKECHEDSDKVMHPIGVKARHINRDYAYTGGTENELTHWSRVGILTGVPSPDMAPRLAAYDDPSSGTVEKRARAWLEINCAHCHNPTGGARTSGLDLRYDQTDTYKYGVCKPPVAAGRGSGGKNYGIVPGNPDDSILVFRIESTVPDIMMPETGRRLPHVEGIALVRQWISEMTGPVCPTPTL